jgi:hypothetical protein
MEIISYKELEKAARSCILSEGEVREANDQLLESTWCGNTVAEIRANDKLPQHTMTTILNELKEKGYSVRMSCGHLIVQLPFNLQRDDSFENE